MKLSRTDKKRDQTENITPGSEQRTGWNPEWLGVRFDVVDSYAWHGTVDEISKVFAPLSLPIRFDPSQLITHSGSLALVGGR